MEGTLNCDFGANGSFFVGFEGWSPVHWNTTSVIPLEYTFNFHDEAEYHPITLRILFHLDLFNNSGDLVFSTEKVIFNYASNIKQNFDVFRTTTSWNLSSLTTGIPKDDSWEGELFMKATVLLGDSLFSNISDSFNIIYHSTEIGQPSLWDSLLNSSNVLFGFIILGLILIIFTIQVRRN
jgi:hypothetical protein